VKTTVGIDSDENVASCCCETGIANVSEVFRIFVGDDRAVIACDLLGVIRAAIENYNGLNFAGSVFASLIDGRKPLEEVVLFIVSWNDNGYLDDNKVRCFSTESSDRCSISEDVFPDQ